MSPNKKRYSDFGNKYTILFKDSFATTWQKVVFPEPESPPMPKETSCCMSVVISFKLFPVKLVIFMFYPLNKIV